MANERDVIEQLSISKKQHVDSEQFGYPFEYTYSWDWRPGSLTPLQIYNPENQQWHTIISVIGAKFRCDSFVYYSYLKGAGLSIFNEFVEPLLPLDMFDTFLSCRDWEGVICRNIVGNIG